MVVCFQAIMQHDEAKPILSEPSCTNRTFGPYGADQWMARHGNGTWIGIEGVASAKLRRAMRWISCCGKCSASQSPYQKPFSFGYDSGNLDPGVTLPTISNLQFGVPERIVHSESCGAF
jgi:hypothetical protein